LQKSLKRVVYPLKVREEIIVCYNKNMGEHIEPEIKTKILEVSKRELLQTVDEIFSKSQPGSLYYTFLVLATFVITPGLLLNNGFIVVGGMLIAPVITPVLLIALGLAVGEPKALRGAFLLLLKSALLVIIISALISLIFGGTDQGTIFDNTLSTAVLYLLVAFAAGSAGTFAWVHKQVSDMLSGIAIAISLVPPLALVGIRLSQGDVEISQFYFLIFFLNLVGLIVGSLVTFSLLKFSKVEKKVQQEVNEAAENSKNGQN